jgi:porphobilinogen synthase
MLYWAAHHGVFELKDGVMESVNAMLRSGASIVISYFVPQLLGWLKEEDK